MMVPSGVVNNVWVSVFKQPYHVGDFSHVPPGNVTDLSNENDRDDINDWILTLCVDSTYHIRNLYNTKK
jgi:hypothetical protein